MKVLSDVVVWRFDSVYYVWYYVAASSTLESHVLVGLVEMVYVILMVHGLLAVMLTFEDFVQDSFACGIYGGSSLE